MTTKIRISITDQDGVVLRELEYDIEKIERAVRKAGKSVLVARDLAFIGVDVDDAVADEVNAALVRNAIERGEHVRG
jgi:hypothetical protein